MKNLLFLLLFFCSATAFSQDYLTRVNGERIATKIIEVDKYVVTYKLFDNLNGPTFKVNKSEIARIEYENGTVENLNSVMGSGNAASAAPADFNRNILSFDFMSIIFSEVGFSYEHIPGEGLVGFRVPLIFGFDVPDYDEVKRVNSHFVSGLDINLYPTGQGKSRYFVGPALRIGSVDVKEYRYDPFGQRDEGRIVRSTLTAFQVNNGVLFQPTRNFSLSMVLGIGIRNLDIDEDDFELDRRYGTFHVNIGYRF